MFKRLEMLSVMSVFILITAILLIINTMTRENDFLAYNAGIQKASVEGAAYAINLQLKNKQKHVRLFIDEYSRILMHLDRYPEDEKSLDNIHNRLQQRFPDFFAFTITDNSGVPKLSDIESLVGEACQNDLNDFSDKLKRKYGRSHNEIFIHPQAENYHYDVMVPLSPGQASRIFFASFYLDEVVDILKTHEIPGQSLMLVRQSVPDLIEVTREGTRDRLSRNFRLDSDELSRIGVYENIDGTDWRLVNLSEDNFEQEFIHGLWQEMLVVLIIVSVSLIVLVLLLAKVSQNRR
jgi:competence protein ComGC